ncbi:MAG: thiamine pyrophosphate-binding protein [Pseudomonadota bacterium]
MTDILRIDDMDRPKDAGKFPMSFASDAIAEMLRRLNIEFVALNPGASFRYLHDSIVNYLGNKNPQMVLCLHEEHAVAIAHGYARVTGKPMGAILHSNVGLLNAAMMIFAAWCGRVPMMILGGTGPLDAEKRRPWIDWIHTAQDQGALVRDYTKWDDQPASVKAALESLLRAYQLSCTAPRAPVYVCLDAALQQEELVGQVTIPDPARFRSANPQQAPPEVLQEAAQLLIKAKDPLMLVGRVSRRGEDWERRVRLAEALGARVVSDMKVGSVFPTGHPLHETVLPVTMPKQTMDSLRRADVILSLDWVDLGGFLKQVWGPEDVGAKVIHCSVDCYIHRGWSKDYQGLPPVDVPILAEPDVILPQLLDMVQAGGSGGRERKRPLDRDALKPAKAGTAQPHGEDSKEPIDLYDLARALETAKGERKVCLIRLPLKWPPDACNFQDPMDYLGGDGGGAVGSGPGMSVGAALALRGTDRYPVAILGDGDFLMGVTALWTAARYRIPLLIIIANNRKFKNTENHQEKVATHRSRPLENSWIGHHIDDPPVDLVAMARAQGWDGEGPVEKAADLNDALSRGFKALEDGRCYLIDVQVGR